MEEIALPKGYQEEIKKPLYQEITTSNFTLTNYLESASADLLSVPNFFENLPQSHINRKETKELFDWIFEPKTEDKNNIAILAGNAGMGKSVVLKDLLVQLIENKTPVLGLKSDRKLLSVNSASIGKSLLDIDADIKSVFDQLSKTNEAVVVLIDQIDALSQSLSTKRSQLTAYTSLINSLAHSKIDKIRIVISCRIYDLKHEAEFKQYRNKKEIILTELSDEEVGTVLKARTGNEISHFPKELIKLLKTPLHLDIFCKIYSNSVSVQKIKTLQDLYRHLWEEKVYNNKNNCAFEATQLEEALFDIARKIELQKENLCAPVSLFSSFYDEIKYLKSENLIVEKENDLQFFHQSFYDYTYARYFVEKEGGNILDYINNCAHQGLFIRSKIKQVISYLRDYNSKLYISQIKEILLSDAIRYHIKLMIIETLAFEENPSIDECKLILAILNYNQSLSAAFFNCIPKIKWMYFFDKKNILPKLINGEGNQLNEAIRKFIVYSADKDPKISLQLLNQITDKEQWASKLIWAFFRVKDFSNPIVLEIYNNIHDEFIDHKGTDYHILVNAIQSNLEFTISEARKIFLKELPEWKKERTRSAGHDRRESHFYEELYKAAPVKQTYLFFKEIITKLSDKADNYPYGKEYKLLNDDYLFSSYDPESYDEHKYVEWIIDWLNKNANIDKTFVGYEVNDFIQSNEILLVFIALRVIENNLQRFLPQAFSILINHDLTEDCLSSDDLRFRYRNIMEKAYPLFSNSERLLINDFIMSFYGEKEKYFNKGYCDERKKYPFYIDKDGILKNRNYPCPFAEYYKYLLLTTIPKNILSKYQNLYMKEKVLGRRFEHWNDRNNAPNRRIGFAQSARGLVSPDRYKYFTLNQWYKSIIKYNSDTFDHARERHFSTSEHAKAFRDVIKENPDKFIAFVEKMMLDINVHIIYKVEAIEGLVEAKYESVKLRQLFGLLILNDIPHHYFLSALRSSHYFIDISFVDDKLIDYWKECINKPFEPNRGTFHTPNEKQRNDVLFAEGWNTINGEGLISIVNLLPLEFYQKYALNYLIEIHPSLPIQLKLVVLYELNSICKHLSNEITLELFKIYTTKITSEIYYVSGQTISNLFDEYFTKLIPFIRATIEMPLAAESLGIYLLYGWFYGHEDSKDLLFELHQLQPDSIMHTLTQAFRYCKNAKFKDKCHFVLNYYVTNKDKEVRDSFSHGFHQLPESDFEQLKELILKHINQLDDDRLHSLYSYLIKCARENAKECLEIQQVINEKFTIKESYHISDPIKLIIFCYNSIREYDSKDVEIEFAMDEFDKFLEKNQVNNELDSFLVELDN